jgi:uncharacterized repeat protein (TIGR01451 family)/LPXTG-motif cell wall-anchored protein
MTKYIFNNKLIFVLSLAAGIVVLVASSSKVYAGCTSIYGGGEECTYNKSFDIEKKVRIEGDSKWKDKVTAEKGDVIEFKIKVKNTGEVEKSGMKMWDKLPKELERVGGSGLTEYFDNFEPGETKTYTIKVKIETSEFDRKDFDKCVVNKAEVWFEDHKEGSSTATVCYSDSKPKELPKTGAESTAAMGAIGGVLTAAGLLIKKLQR